MEFIKDINIVGNSLIITLKEYEKTKLKDLKDEKALVKIDKFSKKRTLQQNAMIWSLIRQIDKIENGHLSDEMSIYKNLLAMANIKYIDNIVYKEVVPELKRVYRVVEELEDRTINNKECTVCRCYIGTSKFNTKEMTDFIEVLLIYCENVGINTVEYERLLQYE